MTMFTFMVVRMARAVRLMLARQGPTPDAATASSSGAPLTGWLVPSAGSSQNWPWSDEGHVQTGSLIYPTGVP
jgi:hypothetical protein